MTIPVGARDSKAALYDSFRTRLAAGDYFAGQFVFCEGRAALGDGGKGFFQIAAIGSYVDNGGTILTGGSFAAVRVFDGAVNVRWFGAVGDGVTDDVVAIQAACDEIANSGSGRLLFPSSTGDWTISDAINFGSVVDLIVEFQGDGYLKLTAGTATGGMITMPANSNATWINPRIDSNSIAGQNGLDASPGGRLRVSGGHFKNFVVAGDYTGGKAIACDGVGADIAISGPYFSNCHSAINLKRDLAVDASASPMSAVISNVSFNDCDVVMYIGIKNSTTNDGTLFSASLTNFNCVDCGLLGGVFVFDRASNVKITNGSVSATATYNSSTPVDSIFRGRGRKLVVNDVQVNQNAGSIINIDPLANYAIDTSAMADNDYQITATGTYGYVFLSDLTDTTHTYRFLDNSRINVTLTNDVSTALISPATRNGSTYMEIRKGSKYLFERTENINGVYTNIAAIPADYFFRPKSGSWTPTLSGDSGSAGAAAYTSSGSFYRIGKQYTLTGNIIATNKGSWTGRVRIGGIPVTSDGTDFFGVCKARFVTPGTTSFDIVCQLGVVSNSQIYFDLSQSGGGGAQLNWTEMANNSELWFSITYLAA